MSEKAPMQSTPFVSSTGETRNPIYEGQFEGESAEQAEARLHWTKVAMEMARNAALSAPSHGEQVREDTRLLDWLEENLADTIYLDDGRIVDIAGRRTVREAIREAAAAPSDGSQEQR